MDKIESIFWTFLINGFNVSSQTAIVIGRFAVCTIKTVSGEDGGAPATILTTEYLTPDAAPVSLDLRSFLPPEIKIDDVSPRAITSALTRVFALPYNQVPRPPTNLKTHKVPPSRRQKMIAAEQAKTGNIGRPDTPAEFGA